MREVVRRLRAAWRVLRHGLPAAPTRPEQVEVSREELGRMVAFALVGAGIAFDWVGTSTLRELETAHVAIGLTLDARRQDWAAIEAGTWPGGGPPLSAGVEP